jgi:hypothetical protein
MDACRAVPFIMISTAIYCRTFFDFAHDAAALGRAKARAARWFLIRGCG